MADHDRCIHEHIGSLVEEERELRRRLAAGQISQRPERVVENYEG